MSSIKISQIEDLVSGDVYDVNTLTVALDSISSLIGFVPTVDKTSVVVKGYHTTNDGGAGIFVWDATEDKANHNGGTIIDPSKTFPADWSDQTALQSWFTGDGLGAGCWKRVYDGAVNVKWFGAKGDGATDDSKAIQSAIDSSTIIKKVVLDEEYLCSSGLVVNINELQITGIGKIKALDSNTSLLTILSNNCIIDAISLEGDGTFTTDKAVANEDRVALIKVTGNYNIISNCVLINGHQNFIHSDNADYNQVLNCALYGGINTFDVTTDTAYQGIRFTDCNYSTIEGNIIVELNGGKVAEGIYISANSLGKNHHNTITNNKISSAYDHGIYCNVSSSSIITNNHTITDYAGIVCAGMMDLTNNTMQDGSIVSNNKIEASPTLAGSIGLYLRDACKFICSGNKIEGFPRGITVAPVTYSNIELKISENVIDSNIINGFTEYGIIIKNTSGFDTKEFNYNTISNNTIIGVGNISGSGIYLMDATGTRETIGNKIINNTITNPGNIGIIVGYQTNTVIANNIITNTAISGAATSAGLYLLNVFKSVIESNIIEDTIPTPTTLYGIDGSNTSDNNSIVNNTILNISSVPIRQMQFDGNNNYFMSNRTGSDSLSGLVTLTANVDVVVNNNNINYGLGYTSYVKLTPIDSSANSLSSYVSYLNNVDKTSFTISSSTTPVGTEIFLYEIIQ